MVPCVGMFNDLLDATQSDALCVTANTQTMQFTKTEFPMEGAHKPVGMPSRDQEGCL